MRTKPTLSRTLFALLILLVMLACNVPSPLINTLVPGGTWYVDKTGSDSNDCLSATSACLTITAAVSKVLTGGVIQIGPGVFEEISTSVPETGLYISDKVLTLQGTSETILSGANARTAVFVEGTAILIIQDLIIQDGGGGTGIGLKIEGSGGSTAGVTLSNVIVENNGQDGLFVTGRTAITLEGVQMLNNGRYGLFAESPKLTIQSSTFSGNTHGAIKNSIGSKMVITDTSISDNGSLPAAVMNDGEMSMERSTVSGTALATDGADPGGVGILNKGTLTMVNSTVAANSKAGIELRGDLSITFSTVAENGEYGFNLVGGSIKMNNSIVENNAVKDCEAVWSDIVRVVADWTSNLSDGTCGESAYVTSRPDPYLGHLANNGGPTQTMALLLGSPAINHASGGASGDWPATDQRGFVRPAGDGGTHDIGAYEFDRSSAVLPLVFVTAETQSGGATGVVPLYTDTPSPKTPIILTFTKNAYCRKGPGILYKDISGFKQGDTAQVDGRNDADTRWWWVQMPNSTEHCWVSSTTVEPNDLAEDLPIQTVSLKLPEPPSSFVISKRVCTAKSYALRFAWTKSTDADGYILYRDGEEIATFKVTQTTFDDLPSMNQYHLYELASFNDDGYSERLGVEDNCP